MPFNQKNACRETKAYKQWVNSCLAFGFRNSAIGNKILCPCRKCVNSFGSEASEMREHLIWDGFLKGYRRWTLHEEASSSCVNLDDNDPDFIEENSEDDDISEFLRDLACGLDDRGDMEDDGSFEAHNKGVEAIQMIATQNNQELYPGCKNYSKLQFLIRLLHIKLIGGWTDRSFDLLVDLLYDALLKDSARPKTFMKLRNW
ncbi:hypothetical protein PR202_ga27767 [Eleusine coracana subsp. coracana]|uniref:Transposase-associated domain-containing protein n=1 Tax=Eleusine coracana subsp. coracana TaxID=191504 RepID=A0AAV5DH40_ELECO|nr:hypothetical protein PR202_ga27767 [Eleusine coracana subsp. coracana]